ncbi:MAG: 50S ribosomal protein L4 [Bacteroidales bacterium]|nr:50S ribosomal protein L4 [Bacteroidales bacterium]
MELTVFNTAGKETGRKVQITDCIVNAEPNDHAIYLDVKQYMANRRQGTHKSKERSEMSGSTKKLGKQKGGGGARRGDINSPLLHGGARVFGPRPRDYDFKLNKKLKRLARLSALAYKFKENNVTVVEDLNFDAPKTKKMTEILKNLNLAEKKSLIVLAESNKFVFLSSRNLPQIRVANVSDLNTYEILNAKNLLFVESSAKKLDEIYASQK